MINNNNKEEKYMVLRLSTSSIINNYFMAVEHDEISATHIINVKDVGSLDDLNIIFDFVEYEDEMNFNHDLMTPEKIKTIAKNVKSDFEDGYKNYKNFINELWTLD